jgi:predicted transcriptional regulator
MTARRRSTALTDGELRIMRVLWDRGRATVADVVDAIDGPDRPAYNTVLTMMGILEQKGYVTHDKAGRAYEYAPLLGRSEARQGALTHVLARFFDGSAELLVANLLQRRDLDAEELRRVRALLDDAAAPPQPGRDVPQQTTARRPTP